MARYGILNVAYPFARVNSCTAGGAEQVLLSLDSAIVNHGFRSYVLAPKGSQVRGQLIEGFESGKLFDAEERCCLHKEYKTILERFLKSETVNLLHFHGIDFREYFPAVEIPALVTLHLPISWYVPGSFNPSEGLFFNCVSKNQQSYCSDLGGMVSFIENGVSVPTFSPRRQRARFCFSMGRICPEKGYEIAIDAAKMAGVPHILAGAVFPYTDHINYFARKIEPRLDGFRYRFIGQIGPVEKRRLLSVAKCLLVPSLAPETSSLVAMEAMSCGTPVIAFRAGALTDIVEDGVNGYLVESMEEMADAVGRVDKIDPEVCHSIAQKKYSVDRMAGQYLELYKKLIVSKSRYTLMPDKKDGLFRDCA